MHNLEQNTFYSMTHLAILINDLYMSVSDTSSQPPTPPKTNKQKQNAKPKQTININ